MRAALYLRVSTRDKGQDVDNQRRQLRQFCDTQGWAIVAEFEDHDSGGKADRPEFNRMRQFASQRQFDVLVFWALDRLTRPAAVRQSAGPAPFFAGIRFGICGRKAFRGSRSPKDWAPAARQHAGPMRSPPVFQRVAKTLS
ncbi:MAG: recombinase family protein [Acidobacteriia bacterium]|nr:recombinase family protein [Terriglobia bacterium]